MARHEHRRADDRRVARSAPLTGQTATLLDSGNVLVTGGSTGSTAVSTVQRYTP
jgi:hypothetical protein